MDYPDGRSQTVNATDPKSGTPTNVTLPNGQSQNQTLNSRGQQQTQNGAGVLPARFTYDDKTGALTGMNLFQSGTFDGTPETTTWAYDPATGLLTKKTYNDGTSDVYDYNAKFELTSLTRPGVFINYHYDASGRQTTTDATDNASGLTVTDSVGAYDDQGRPTSVTQTTSDAGGETQSTATNTYSYDKNGNLASETQAAGVTAVYHYYAPNDTTSFAEPGALSDVELVKANGTLITETQYQYGQISKRLNTVIVGAYNADGTLAASQSFTYIYKSGTNLVQSITAGEVQTTYGYEANTGRLSNITTTTTGTDPISTLYQADYTYFNNDQRKTESVTQLDSDGNTNSHNWTFAYDAANELTGVTNTVGGASVYGYTYDGAGNQTGTPMGVANGLNQFANFTYNARGDLLDDGIYHYTWNALDQLVSETPDNPTEGSQKLQEQYDANARRTETDAYNWNATTGEWDDEADKVLKYVYQGSQLAAELDGNNNPIVTMSRGANGTLLSITDYTSGTPHIYVVLQDATSNTVGLADPANGAVVACFHYAPFGAFTSDNGPEANACPEMFAGMICDGSAALPYYAWHRYYSSAEDRWLSADPIAENGGLNRDAYAANDPINLIDNNGEAGRSVNGYAINESLGGHHFVPVELWADTGLAPEALEIWDSTRLYQPDGSGHDYTAHGKKTGYSAYVKEELAMELNEFQVGRGAKRALLTIEEQKRFATQFLEHIRTMPKDTYIGGYLDAVQSGGSGAVQRWYSVAGSKFKQPWNPDLTLWKIKTVASAGAAASEVKLATRIARNVRSGRGGFAAIKMLGPLATFAALALDARDVAVSSRPLATGAEKAGGWAGGALGAEVFGAAGSFFGPIGTLIGGVAGWTIGYFGGEQAVHSVVDTFDDFERTQEMADDYFAKTGRKPPLRGPAGWVQFEFNFEADYRHLIDGDPDPRDFPY